MEPHNLRKTRVQRPQAGFTLVEVMVVGALMAVLAFLLPMAWEGLGQPSVDTMIRCRIGQEAQLAAMSLAADCGGSLPTRRSSIAGEVQANSFAGAEISGEELKLSYADGTTVNYQFDESRQCLVRKQRLESGTLVSSLVVASNLHGMDLDDTDASGRIRVALTFYFRDPATAPDKYRHPYQYVFYLPKEMP